MQDLESQLVPLFEHLTPGAKQTICLYLSGYLQSKHLINDAFSELGKKAASSHFDRETQQAIRVLENKLIQIRDGLIAKTQVKRNPNVRDDPTSQLISALLDSEQGQIFFHSVIFPLCQPLIESLVKNPKLLPETLQEDFKSQITFGPHISDTPRSYKGSLYNAIIMYHGDASFKTYFHSIVFNSVRTLWTKLIKKRHINFTSTDIVDNQTGLGILDKIGSDDLNPAEVAAKADNTQAVEYCAAEFRKRSFNYLAINQLALLEEGYDGEERASRLNVSAGTIRSNLFYLRGKIRWLHDEYIGQTKDQISAESFLEAFMQAYHKSKGREARRL